jgi:hypothetical protein
MPRTVAPQTTPGVVHGGGQGAGGGRPPPRR